MKLKNVDSNGKKFLVRKTHLTVFLLFEILKIEFKKQLHMLFSLHVLQIKTPHNFHLINWCKIVQSFFI